MCTEKLINFSTLQTSTDAYANSVDPYGTARNKPSNRDLHCLPFCFSVKIKTSIFNNGSVQIQRWVRPLQRVNDNIDSSCLASSVYKRAMHDKTYNKICAQFDQSLRWSHVPSTFPGYLKGAKREPSHTGWMYREADLNLCWSHRSYWQCYFTLTHLSFFFFALVENTKPIYHTVARQ